MEIKKLLTKTLLAAALLCVGQSAWGGDVTTLYEKGTAGHNWTNADIASSGTYVWGGNAEITTKGYPYVSGNGGRTSSMTIVPSSDVILTVDAVWFTGDDNSYGNNYTYFRIGNNLEFQAHTTNQTGNVVINGTSYVIANACGKNNGNRTNDEWTIHAVINTATKELTELTLAGKNGTIKATYTLASPVSLGANATFTSMTFGTYREKYSPNCGLMSLSISEETQSVSSVDYTINYKLGDDVVKTVSSNGVLDQVITADVAIDGTEAGYEGKHYLITAAEAPTMTLVAEAASNVLNVPVRAPLTATLKVTTTIGTNDPVLVTTPLVETDAKVHAWSYAYPMYVLDGGKYYKADNTTTFGEGGEFTDGQVIEKFVTYSTIAEDVVFFKEAEAAAGTNYSYSNGGSGYVAAQNARDRGISVGTLPAGTYQFTVNITAANRRSLVIRQSTNDQIVSVGTSNEDMTTGVKSDFFTLVEEKSNLYINGANSGTDKTNQSEDFDYVLIKKVPESLSGTIASSGYSTLSSAYGLDFANATASEGELVAYAVTEIQQDKVVMTSVDEMSANQGVVLKGTANATYTIPVNVDAAYEGTNLLKAAVEATSVAADEAYILKDGKFIKVTAASTVPAGKAYLLASDIPAGAREMTFVFNDDTTTGISNVNAEKMLNGDFFDLQGRRVAAPQKGLYIVSGKKVIIK